MARRFVDLSIYLENDVMSDPPPLAPKITYQTHRETMREFNQLLPGTQPEDFPDGEAAAAEWVSLSTHNGTHLDAPYHFHSTMNKGERSITIDEVPLDWCFQPGVKLDFRHLPDGLDDMGFVLGFQLTVRRPIHIAAEHVNAPGGAPLRPANIVAVDEQAEIIPRTLSHVVYFVPDAAKAEAFYVDRLKFRCTDRFIGTGPFLRPAGSLDHHTLFMIQTPPFMKGCEHFTFHLGGPTEVLQAGTRFANKGYQSFWGPGRHTLGSNWFWYFNSPFNCHIEYDADMDLHDDSWQARAVPISADSSQLFLFQQHAKWSPGGPPVKAAQ
jgi:catechol 2,3-dioxygenase-like lactoylglutathione lyase family enzyme